MLTDFCCLSCDTGSKYEVKGEVRRRYSVVSVNRQEGRVQQCLFSIHVVFPSVVRNAVQFAAERPKMIF